MRGRMMGSVLAAALMAGGEPSGSKQAERTDPEKVRARVKRNRPPFTRDQERARRRRQIASGMLRPESRGIQGDDR